jgi:uncharacterized protein (DUF3820 family)
MSTNHKLELLKEALGDLSQYHSSRWFWYKGEDTQGWRQQGKTQIYPEPSFNPDVSPKCYCKTPIVNHYLIYNKNGEAFFIGSECNKRFDGHLKRCLQCNDPYRGKYRFCKDCRKYCKTHSEFHDDNKVHNTFKFGKYKGRTILDVYRINRGYLEWVRKTHFFRSKYPEALVEINELIS